MSPDEVKIFATLLSRETGRYTEMQATHLIAEVLRENTSTSTTGLMPPVYYDTLEQANIARQREWLNSDKLDLSFLGNAAAGEMGEACNVIKKLERERLGLAGSRATIAELGRELADVVIYVSLLAIKAGVDLDKNIFEKFNETSEQLGFRTRLR